MARPSVEEQHRWPIIGGVAFGRWRSKGQDEELVFEKQIMCGGLLECLGEHKFWDRQERANMANETLDMKNEDFDCKLEGCVNNVIYPDMRAMRGGRTRLGFVCDTKYAEIHHQLMCGISIRTGFSDANQCMGRARHFSRLFLFRGAKHAEAHRWPCRGHQHQIELWVGVIERRCGHQGVAVILQISRTSWGYRLFFQDQTRGAGEPIPGGSTHLR
jgi:hypothetical protein